MDINKHADAEMVPPSAALLRVVQGGLAVFASGPHKDWDIAIASHMDARAHRERAYAEHDSSAGEDEEYSEAVLLALWREETDSERRMLLTPAPNLEALRLKIECGLHDAGDEDEWGGRNWTRDERLALVDDVRRFIVNTGMPDALA